MTAAVFRKTRLEEMAHAAKQHFEEHNLQGPLFIRYWQLKSDYGNMDCTVLCDAHRSVVASGDIDLVSFQYGPANHGYRLAWIGRSVDFDYIASKARIGMSDTKQTLTMEYVPELAVLEIREWADEWEKSNGRLMTEDQLQAVREATTMAKDGWSPDVIRGSLSDSFVMFEELEHLGQCISPRVVNGWAAIRRVCECLGIGADG